MEERINSAYIKELFAKSADIVVRPITLNQNGITLYIFGVDGLINTGLVDEVILNSLNKDTYLEKCKTQRQVMDYLLSGGSYHVFTKEETEYAKLIKIVLSGGVAFLFDEESIAIIYDIRMFE